ncbi:hybrid sensor histidine kinase/response regulator [Solitalea koreensis]|uniref:histidine kinase n=1 Tax=Solitalea koreensis TaxID=543615 RepID=A0A521EBL0_9SPHI|nr:hybrid sensor histidine kinase/response regulator [Solitalea koreensis]SMO81334.1 Signal transduction histidine kinase [Solitalea koreensis]
MPKPNQKIKILYIDDEQNNLNSFKAVFRRDYEIYTALSAEEAVGILNEHADVHLIIADQRMPKCTGVEFFASIIKEHPDPRRILLTGYADMESLIGAINNGNIYRYITKPWNELELRNTIQNAYEAYRVNQELKEKNQELTKVNEELSRFIYSASHELRSPLLSVLGIVNLAKLENSVVDPYGYLNMIANSVHQLDGFVLKLIEYYQNTRVESIFENINFNGLIKETIDSLNVDTDLVKHEFCVDQEIPFFSDKFRVGLVLKNLIDNALKFRRLSEPFPVVKIKVKVDSENATVLIQDNGQGIQEEYLNKIFTMFFRTKIEHEGQGNGIGLYIVKEALNKMNGTISVQSTYNVGSSFEVIIPNIQN